MTEVYGPCGIGWKYEIIRLWKEQGDKEVFAFSEIKLYIKDGVNWSDPIPGIGGHLLVIDEKDGLYNNDEAYKMATTDALSVAMKMLGVGAEVYLGNWDGSKYTVHTVHNEQPAAQSLVSPSAPATQSNTPSNGKFNSILIDVKKSEWTDYSGIKKVTWWCNFENKESVFTNQEQMAAKISASVGKELSVEYNLTKSGKKSIVNFDNLPF